MERNTGGSHSPFPPGQDVEGQLFGLLSNLNPPSCEAARSGFVLISGKGKWPMIAGHRVNRDDSRPQDTAWEQEQAPVSRAKHRNPGAAERSEHQST